LVALAAALALAVQAPPPAKVSVVPVEVRSFQPSFEALGELRAPKVSAIGAEVAGRVHAVDVREGDRVAAGQALARLDTTFLEIVRDRARAEFEWGEEQLAELRAGSRVEDVAEAEALHAEAVAQRIEQERDVGRLEELRQSDDVSEQEWTTAIAARDAAIALEAARRAALDRVRAGPRAEEVARAEAEVSRRAAVLAHIERELAKAVIAAPFAGGVTMLHAQAGAFVRVGDPLVTLVQLDPLEAVIDVQEQRIDAVRSGSPVKLRLDALPGLELDLQVTAVVPSADRLARTFPVRIEVANPEHRLLPGMVARATLPAGAEREGLAVPRDCIVVRAAGATVFVVEEGRAREVRVVVADEADGLVRIEPNAGGLAVGDQVVRRGNEGLFPGREVVVVPDPEAGAP
jgi:multidrug efflux pump subunit AcrA (membrane-fusion protein)